MRTLMTLALGLATLISAVAAAQAGDAKTIRIEPRAFYGATVSLESGVRVFRPLPAASHVIINPNRTPLRLTIKDVTKRVTSTSHHHFYGTTTRSRSRVGLPFVNRFRGRRHRARGTRRRGQL